MNKVYWARARVYRRDGTWHYSVETLGKIVTRDNLNNYPVIMHAAREAVWAFDHVVRVGHYLEKDFDQLVDEA